MRPLVLADLPAAMSLLERVGLASGATNIARYLALQPDGCWWDDAGGMVTVLRHGSVGFIGCMAVEPALQGRGVGRRLLEHAHHEARAAGVTTFLLEATPAGAHLYERLGYVHEHGTWIVGRTRETATLAQIPAAHHAGVLALDRAATGTPRPMIASLLSHPGAVVEARGELAGYGLVVGDRLGPLVARSAEAGRDLVARLAAPCTVAGVPEPNEAARRALADAGFTDVRRLSRMRLGPPVDGHPDWVWTLASAGAG